MAAPRPSQSLYPFSLISSFAFGASLQETRADSPLKRKLCRVLRQFHFPTVSNLIEHVSREEFEVRAKPSSSDEIGRMIRVARIGAPNAGELRTLAICVRWPKRNANAMTDVIIELRGGAIQNVTVNRESVRVTVIDWDDIACAPVGKHKTRWVPLQKMESLDPETLRFYEQLAKQ